ncbi:hypothetical protein L226DRAFT_569017 [Lentinus tigrinus ALCF2SS1-7]|uniref:DUF7727 domain-containing protein n=1 Tax=Lentinus tigrinus ALCF2SS1-6 TaxID=1328759 RepID=A0A5C2RSV4_9APHY|nr:hypothetical protein L227DRAFT_657402 [Lentinus tigrinus ALCF2SS1-6]RPD76758.1 hypothetical protein L226DRAFT_569017 [Lentinus tigrinus ALCF2SS1-7]
MGNLVWHEYARYVSLTATVYTIWAAFFGIYYRKFFWDFVHGIVRAPGGLQPAASDGIFVSIIVKAPVVQLLNMVLGFGLLALDYPLPFLKNSAIHRSFPIRIVLLLLQAFFAILYYQGTNGAIYSIIAALCYTRAQLNGEVMPEAKDNKGRGGRA